MPSISVSSCETILLSTSFVASSLLGAIASISSMNIMLGDFSFASLNIPLSFSSLSPTNLLTSSGPDMEMKCASLSLATAFASSVLPVPGDPKRSTPLGGSMPSLSKSSGYLIGYSTISLIFCISLLSPPMSS